MKLRYCPFVQDLSIDSTSQTCGDWCARWVNTGKYKNGKPKGECADTFAAEMLKRMADALSCD